MASDAKTKNNCFWKKSSVKTLWLHGRNKAFIGPATLKTLISGAICLQDKARSSEFWGRLCNRVRHPHTPYNTQKNNNPEAERCLSRKREGLERTYMWFQAPKPGPVTSAPEHPMLCPSELM